LTKTSEVMGMLQDTTTTSEIVEKVGCSKQLVTQCHKKMKVDEPANDLSTDEEMDNKYEYRSALIHLSFTSQPLPPLVIHPVDPIPAPVPLHEAARQLIL